MSDLGQYIETLRQDQLRHNRQVDHNGWRFAGVTPHESRRSRSLMAWSAVSGFFTICVNALSLVLGAQRA